MFNGIIEPLKIQTSPDGKLENLTFAVKDLLDIEGMVTGGGNPDWMRTHGVASSNCAAVQSILAEGACLVGKTLTDELAFSLDGLNMHYPIPHNPNFPGSIPGGSSSGSASAVANNACDFALGTDTAGSIRVPSAYCGIYGMRPTHGSISLQGTIPLGTTFDTIGWMSRSLDLMNRAGSVLLSEEILQPKMQQVSLFQDGLSILEPKWHPCILEKWQLISDLCRKFDFEQDRRFDLKDEFFTLEMLSEWFNHARGFEAWKAHGDWFKHVRPNMSAAIKQRFESCANGSQVDYNAALSRRDNCITAINQKLSRTFLFLPTVCNAPPSVDASESELSENRKANILLNSLASFCGLPQVTIPYNISPTSDKGSNKFAFSLLGRRGSDMQLLALARFIEHSGILA